MNYFSRVDAQCQAHKYPRKRNTTSPQFLTVSKYVALSFKAVVKEKKKVLDKNQLKSTFLFASRNWSCIVKILITQKSLFKLKKLWYLVTVRRQNDKARDTYSGCLGYLGFRLSFIIH